jgi:hypothetical protein
MLPRVWNRNFSHGAVAGGSGCSTPICWETTAAEESGLERGKSLMQLSQDERARIREEELIRLEARKEVKIKQTPRLILFTVFWAAVLTALALIDPLLHHH